VSKNGIRISDSQGNEELTIIGTEQQIALLREMAGSLQRGTLLQDVARLIPQPEITPALAAGMARTDEIMEKVTGQVSEAQRDNILGVNVRLLRCAGCQQSHKSLHFKRLDRPEFFSGQVFHFRATCPRSKRYVYLRIDDIARQTKAG
jgi:hypothetical protein